MLIKGKTKLSEALSKHPELKQELLKLSPKFSKLNNKMIFNVVSKWATFNDIAKVGRLSICELLHSVNATLGNEGSLVSAFPECINDMRETNHVVKKPDWFNSVSQIIILDVREFGDFFLPKIIEKLKQLEKNQALKIINSFDPLPLKTMLEEMGNKFFSEEISEEEYHLTINFKEAVELTNENWKEHVKFFEEMNVIGSKEDPFEAIMKKAQNIKQGEGFTLIQMFVPEPLINMLTPLGFEYFTEEINPFKHNIYFFRTIDNTIESNNSSGEKVKVVIQSATPITYPIIMRMLQSKKLMSKIEISELKVWEKTEKHMAWIINGKADITFSAVASAAKLYLTGAKIRMVSVDIWDNFHLLTRDYAPKTFEDIKGHAFQIPLFKGAPPKIMTDYLMKENNYNPDDFEFVFGNPFGRPEEITADFVAEKTDTVLLREPEASFALHQLAGRGHESISYTDLWKNAGNNFETIPNAGLIFKEEFIQENPEIAKLFVEEMKEAIDWVNNNKHKSAKQCYDIMQHSVPEVELFLNRVKFKNVKSESILGDIINYLQVVNNNTEKYTKEALADLFKGI